MPFFLTAPQEPQPIKYLEQGVSPYGAQGAPSGER